MHPECELRLTLIHSYDAVNVLNTRVLKPCMPLTHFKAFFCEQMNLAALHTMYQWYNHTLTSLWWVDSTDSPTSDILLGPEAPDPLVMVAWRCTQLHEIVLLGYKYCDEDLMAIARLKRTRLKRLEIAERDVIQELCPLDGLKNDVSDSMGKPWAPLQDSQLHDVILNPIQGDSDEYILPILMQDQLS
uniref:Uncharacterized protein n=1 Tax=Timema shepardi TaxID=629360 RepID=A0A7R9FYK7_TIMSH|nr:unnamed protein product [Timema shepardi]